MANSRLLLGLACVGVSVCAACGSSFVGDGTGIGGSAGAGAVAGASAGAADAGSTAAGGPSAGASGATSAGAGGASGGTTSVGGTAGSSGGTTSAGASGSSGKGGAAGSAGTAGAGGGPDCATLKTEYAALLEKARVCDKGSTDQCSASSTLPTASSCGCPTLVNAMSDATVLAQKKYKQLQDNKCLNTGIVCNIACAVASNASCEQQTSGMGSGGYVCTATPGAI